MTDYQVNSLCWARSLVITVLYISAKHIGKCLLHVGHYYYCSLTGHNELKYDMTATEDEETAGDHSDPSKPMLQDLTSTEVKENELCNTKAHSFGIGCGIVSQGCLIPVSKGEHLRNSTCAQSACSKPELPVKQRVLAGYKIPKLCVTKDTSKEKSSASSDHKKVPHCSSLPTLKVLKLEPAENSTSTQKKKRNRQEGTEEHAGSKEEKEECQEAVLEDHKEMHTSRLADVDLNCDSTSSSDWDSKIVTNGRVNVRELVKKVLDVHFDKGHIKNRQYKRILERATLKIEKHITDVPIISENRVRKLVADYVDAYRKIDVECK